MSNQADYHFVLEETLSELRKRAEQIQPNSTYDEGRLVGYYEILSEAINQARVVGLDINSLGLEGFNPDKLLKKDFNDIIASLQPLYNDINQTIELCSGECVDFHQRILIRNFFSFVEGATWRIKQACLVFDSPNTNKALSDGERCVLNEREYNVNDDGDMKERDMHINLKANIKFTNNVFNKIFGASVDLYSSPGRSRGWNSFLESIKTRNRVTHPKKDESYDIQGSEFNTCLNAMEWYADLLGFYINELRDHQRISDEVAFVSENGVDYEDDP